MIIVRSPLRLSFFGGGTDVRDYYKLDYGCVLGEAINKYVYVVINKRFEKAIRVSYLKNEIVLNVNKIKHNLIRESLKEFKIRNGIEIVTVADVPGTGTGLGSSSSLAVSLCNSLSIFSGKTLPKRKIAEKACKLEIEKVGSPIGKQDQYFATFGGILFLKFHRDGRVKVERIKLNKNTSNDLEQNILTFYTGIPRKANFILKQQNQRMKMNLNSLDKLREMAEEARDYLKNNDLMSFSHLLDKSWQLKKTLTQRVSNPNIELIYKKAIRAGAIGGKLSGAGGGGFIFLYCEPRYQRRVRESLKNYQELKFELDNEGTTTLVDNTWRG